MSPERSNAYRRVMKTLEDIGPSKLLDHEQQRIRYAADNLIFCHHLESDVEAQGALVDVEDLAAAWLRPGAGRRSALPAWPTIFTSAAPPSRRSSRPRRERIIGPWDGHGSSGWSRCRCTKGLPKRLRSRGPLKEPARRIRQELCRRFLDGTWIGLRATILPGCVVGRDSIVGACPVVTRDVPPYAIVGGNPARVIGTRDGTSPPQAQPAAAVGPPAAASGSDH